MYKYKVMIIDDEICSRINYLSDFFTNKMLDRNANLTELDREKYKQEIGIEFEVCYPMQHENLDEYVKSHKADAYFLDVYLEKGQGWNLSKAITAIYKYNKRAPIFAYSTSWREKEVLNEVTNEFRDSWQEKTVSYFYDLNRINKIVSGLDKEVTPEQIEMLKRERRFIKDVIVRAYGKTEKVPFSENEDITILHISDIQSGDPNTTKYNANLWAEVVNVCEKLKGEKEIAGIDLLAITGDISMHGKSKEMREIEKELNNYLIKKLWPDEYCTKDYQERILLVPGNHDFDLNFCSLDYLISQNGPNKDDRKIDFEKASESLKNGNRKKICDDYRIMGLTAYREFAYRLTGNQIHHQSKHLNYVDERFTSWQLRIICLNTCDGIVAEKTNGVAIDEEEYKEIVNGQYNDGCYTLVLSHHSPLFESQLCGDEKEEFKTKYITIINSCHVGTWLSGHGHEQKDRLTKTTVQMAEVYEASTISLKEEWTNGEEYIVQTVDGDMPNARRGFQIIVLKKGTDGTYKPEVIPYVFDEVGAPHRVRR